jgi:hypothetical protein
MRDFTTEIVEMFLTLLEDGQVRGIREGDLREPHEISSVFEMKRLQESCRNLLEQKINGAEETMEYDTTLLNRRMFSISNI